MAPLALSLTCNELDVFLVRETEMASSITETERVLPDMLLQQPGLCTGLAFDNYDELIETLSG